MAANRKNLYIHSSPAFVSFSTCLCASSIPQKLLWAYPLVQNSLYQQSTSPSFVHASANNSHANIPRPQRGLVVQRGSFVAAVAPTRSFNGAYSVVVDEANKTELFMLLPDGDPVCLLGTGSSHRVHRIIYGSPPSYRNDPSFHLRLQLSLLCCLFFVLRGTFIAGQENPGRPRHHGTFRRHGQGKRGELRRACASWFWFVVVF